MKFDHTTHLKKIICYIERCKINDDEKSTLIKVLLVNRSATKQRT